MKYKDIIQIGCPFVLGILLRRFIFPPRKGRKERKVCDNANKPIKVNYV